MNPLLPKENSILLYISMIVFCACNEIKEQNPLVIDSLSITQQQASNDELNWQDQISLDSSIANGSQELATNVTFPELNQSLADFDSVKVKGETYYIAEGDLLLSRQELIQRLNFENLLGPIEGIEKKDTQKAVVIKDHKTGNIIKWTKFPLSFAIDQHSFSTIPNGYPNVRAAILKAVQDWQSACGVKMIYLEHLDNRPGIQAGSEVDFVVSYLPSDKKETIATSFFPTTPIERRAIHIYPLYWNTNYDQTGIFRHEIGHIFGFRHEETARFRTLPTSCEKPTEQGQYSIGVKYDNVSVMHYFCGRDNGTKTLAFSKNDVKAFNILYPKN